ncbi:MAG: DUF1961 family protein, partial [Saprospiraceae bacterium]|nr:DUF1961 family protein [Saprospiraceae bacterium]
MKNSIAQNNWTHCWTTMSLLIFNTVALIAQPDLNPVKGDLIYSNNLDHALTVEDWVLEGPVQIEFKDDWMEMYSPDEEGHHVFWCPKDFPGSFVAEWELQNLELDAGLCIIFFAAKGAQGESIFDPDLKPRGGIFSSYTKSDINCYHISYYAHTPNAPNRPHSHLRKNAGFHKVAIGEAPISPLSTSIHKATLVKRENHIVMYLDDRKIIDWQDDGRSYGPVLGGGKIGFRQMQWTHFRYRNFKVWNIAEGQGWQSDWPRHIIDNSSAGADGVKMADLNSDQNPDLVTGWEEGGVTKLYLNPGPERVRYPWPSVVVGTTPSVEDAVFFDMDEDGFPEIVSCTEKGAEEIYVHRLTNQDFSDSKNWEQEILPESHDKMMWMYAESGQIDNQNGIDLVAGGKGDKAFIGWFQAPADAGNLKDWQWHEISPVGWIMSIILRDMDGDADLDVVITDRNGEQRGCRWLENPGQEKEITKHWQSHPIGAMGLEVMFMTMADLNGDGREEAIVSERTHQTIRIYEMTSDLNQVWHESVIQLPDSVRTAKSVEVGDLNRDGMLDFVISTNTNGKNTDGLFWLDGHFKQIYS